MNEKLIFAIALILAVLLLLLIVSVYYLYKSYKAMQESFSKIGYIAREDTKRYFQEAAEQAERVYAGSLDINKTVIIESMKKVLSESSEAMKGTISSSQQEAAQIILSAHRDAESIKNEAKAQSEKYFRQMLGEATKVIDWAMSQYIGEKYTIADHEELIRKQIESYLNEQGN